MKVKKGYYIKDKWGNIEQVLSTGETMYHNRITIGGYMERSVSNVVLMKKDWIELLEIGDYINGHKIISIVYDNYKNNKIKGFIAENNNYYEKKNIKTILTEQAFNNRQKHIDDL